MVGDFGRQTATLVGRVHCWFTVDNKNYNCSQSKEQTRVTTGVGFADTGWVGGGQLVGGECKRENGEKEQARLERGEA